MIPTARALRRLLSLLLLPCLAACGGGGGAPAGGGGGTPPPGPDTIPPTVVLLAPTTNQMILPGDLLRVSFTADDDRDAEVKVVLDPDGDTLTEGDQIVLFTGTDQNGTPVALDLDTSTVPVGRATLFVRVDDGTHPAVWDAGPEVVAYTALAGVSPPRANRYGVTGGHVVFSVGEAEQGNTILNGDGNADDGVVSVLDVFEGTAVQTGLSIDVTPVGLQPTAQILHASADAIAWHQRESDQGQNLNLDGDFNDTVVSYVAPLAGIPATTNPTGGAVLTSAETPHRRVVQYDETAHGTDLNGDGDALDLVVAMLEYATNTLPVRLVPQLMPGTSFVGATGFGAYLADEATQGPGNGGLSLNADGDPFDTLVVVVDLDAGGPVTVGANNVDPTAALAVSRIAPFAAYFVDEVRASPGTSLNGDGDSADFVPSINTGLPLESFPIPPSPSLNGGLGARLAFVHDSVVVQVASEEGANDFNGDGDTGDTEVLWWADAGLPTPVWTQIAPGIGTLTGLALDGGSAAMVSPGWLALAVQESANATVLNGDGDQSDVVYLLVNLTAAPPVVYNTQLVPLAPASLPLPGATLPITGVGGDTGVVVQATETASADLNGDGDAIDTVLVYFDWTSPTSRRVLGDTGGLHAAVRGGVIGVTAYEGLTLEDHNGDGDTLDFVFRALDTTGAVLLPGILCDQSSVPATGDGFVWAFLRSESAEGRNLNAATGDADLSDLILGLWAP